MRIAIASLIALGFASAAVAQDAAPAAAPAPEAAPAAPAPDAAAPDAAAPAAPAPDAAAAPAPVPEKTYELPTTGDAGQIISVINNVCKPLVQSKAGNLDDLMKPLGYKKNKREGTWTAQLGAKPYSLTIWPQGSNRDVCRLSINYAVDQEKPIIVGLNIFSYLHKPELLQQRNDFVPATDYKRITNSWEFYDENQSIGLVFLQLKKPDGTSAGKGFDMGEILYSERKLK